MINPIKISYDYTDDYDTAKQRLSELDAYPVLALDFEAAVKYSPDEINSYKEQLNDSDLDFWTRIELQQRVNATALSHVSHSFPTHLSIAWSDRDAYVIIIHTWEILQLVMNWLVTTSTKQVWHNASYDFNHIYYHTKQFPKDFEDTALLAKTILNHVQTHLAKVGLKELAGHWYGPWGLSADNFTVDQMYEPHMLEYAAIDACATYKLWTEINDKLQED